MKKAIALVMTAVMALATPASVLAEEWDDVIISEEIYEEPEGYVTLEEPTAEINDDSFASEIIIDDEFQEIEEEPLPEDNSGIGTESVPEEIQNQESGAEVVIEWIEEVPADSYDISTYEVSSMSEVASGTCGDDLTWILDDEGTLTIAGCGNMTSWSSSSTAPWFSDRTSIQSIVIEDGVSTIGEYAFYGCMNTTNISIPDSIIEIGVNAFDSCSKLTTITLPDNIKELERNVFNGCSNLTNITLPKNLVSIGYEAFCNCSSLKEIDFQEGLQTIEGSAFYGCSSLEKVVFPEGLLSIGGLIFGECKNLSAITLPESLTTIPYNAFQDCYSLKEVVIPDGITAIESNAFVDCTGLESISLSKNLSFLGSAAFERCSSLKSIELPEGIVTIDGATFDDCSSLEEIIFPEGLVSIGNSAFYSCSSLTSIELPESVTSIGNAAFSRCTGLDEIVLPQGLISIGDSAFSSCTGLVSITIPEKITSLEDNIFYRCISLESITLPAGIVSIGDSAFDECFNLIDVFYEGNQDNWEQIKIGTSNDSLSMAVIHCNDTVIPADISNYDVMLSNTDIVYDGTEKKPDVTVIYGSKELSEGIDYYVSYDNNINAGEASVTITGIGNYTGIVICEFFIDTADPELIASIEKDSLKVGETTNIVASGLGGITYSSKDSSIAEVDDSGKITAKGVGSTIITVETTDKDNYDPAVWQFSVSVYKADQTVTAEAFSSTLEVGETTTITASGQGNISFSSNNISVATVSSSGVVTGISEGTAVITVTASGNDNYNSGYTTVMITIKDSDTGSAGSDNKIKISGLNISLSESSYIYDGTAKKPSVTVKNGNAILTNGSDYSVSYSNNLNAGTATVTIKGMGDYTGETTKNFTINKASQTLTVTVAASSIEVGKTTTITASGKGTITYSSSNTSIATVSSSGDVTGKAAGSVTITVKAAGNSNYNSASTAVKITVSLKKGSSYTSGDFVYKILTLPSSGTGTVRVTGPAKSSIKTADIPAKVAIGGRSFKVTEIGAKAFKGCTKLKTVAVGKNVTTIGNQAFQGCTKMTGISIKTGTTTIGKKVFYNCKNLKTITIKSKKLTSVGANAFKGIKSNATIKVPASKLKAYTKLLKGKGQGSKVKITS